MGYPWCPILYAHPCRQFWLHPSLCHRENVKILAHNFFLPTFQIIPLGSSKRGGFQRCCSNDAKVFLQKKSSKTTSFGAILYAQLGFNSRILKILGRGKNLCCGWISKTLHDSSLFLLEQDSDFEFWVF